MYNWPSRTEIQTGATMLMDEMGAHLKNRADNTETISKEVKVSQSQSDINQHCE